MADAGSEVLGGFVPADRHPRRHLDDPPAEGQRSTWAVPISTVDSPGGRQQSQITLRSLRINGPRASRSAR
jgi:hypothetical protein